MFDTNDTQTLTETLTELIALADPTVPSWDSRHSRSMKTEWILGAHVFLSDDQAQ